MANLIDCEHELFKDYTETAIRNVEIFRSEAQMFHGRFTHARRLQIKRLRSKGMDAYDVLTAWQEQSAPGLEKLEEARSSSVFNKSIAKHLQVQGIGIQDTVDQIIQQRRDQLNNQFIGQFKGASKKRVVRELVEKSLKEMYALKDQYVRVALIRIVAKEHGINIVDPHSSSFRRLITMVKVRLERKRLNREEKKRINEINLRIQEIEKADDGLIGEIVRLRIDLVTILAARTDFEKRIARLKKDEAIDAATRLEIFNEETRTIRHNIMSSLPGSIDMSLESAYNITKVTDKLLLRIFDLTNTQKNNLLVMTKEHREIREEREQITQSQKERLAIIK